MSSEFIDAGTSQCSSLIGGCDIGTIPDGTGLRDYMDDPLRACGEGVSEQSRKRERERAREREEREVTPRGANPTEQVGGTALPMVHNNAAFPMGARLAGRVQRGPGRQKRRARMMASIQPG